MRSRMFGTGRGMVMTWGLTLLGVTLLKILAVDMAGVETIWRIGSFTAVGALLLCVSFVYYRQMEERSGAVE